MNRFFIFITAVLSVLSLRAQSPVYQFNHNCNRAYELLLQLNFEEANTFIKKEKNENKENLIPLLLENYQDFLKMVLFEDQLLFEELDGMKKKRLNQWKKGPKDCPWYLAGQAQIKLQWAFSRVVFDEYFTAATEINSAYHLLEENQEKFPEFLNDNMGIGILHAMIGVVPDQYQWALEFFGFYGTIEQGMYEVKTQLDAQAAQILQQETLFYYTFLRLNLQNDTARFTELLEYYETPYFADLTNKSPLLSFSKAILLMRKDNNQAIEHLKAHYPLYQKTHFYYPVFLLGQTMLYQLNEEAPIYLNEYLNKYPGKNYKKTTLQRLAWMAYIGGDTNAYQQYMKRVKTEGASLLDSDKSALKEAEKCEEGQLPNSVLLKARILFDGHYYQEALEALEELDENSLNQQDLLEFHYRMGRVYHDLKQYDLAIKAYSLAIKEGKNSERYFAAKAALKIGEIEEQRAHYSAARLSYEECLKLNFSEYRRGIRAKAKAGLQRVKNQSSN